MTEHGFPVILGRDFAGVVDQVGSGVSRYQVGDDVFGFLLHAAPHRARRQLGRADHRPGGQHVAAKPGSVDFAVAGAAPLAAIRRSPTSTRWRPMRARRCSSSVRREAWAASSSSSPLARRERLRAGASRRPRLPARTRRQRARRPETDPVKAVREAHPDGVDAILDVVSPTPDASLLKEGGRLASPVGAAGEGAGASTSWPSPLR